MTLIWKREISKMTERAVHYIARSLYQSNLSVFVNTKESPFLYLRLLKKEFGIQAKAIPIKNNSKRIIGYRFKTAA